MRKHNWPELLNVFIKSRKDVPFEWGKQDCCLFACDLVKEMTGVDYASDFRGTYNNVAGALTILKKEGGVKQLAINSWGVEINPLMAQRGDVVLVQGEHGNSLAVCIGQSIVATGENGLVSLPLRSAICAWRIK